MTLIYLGLGCLAVGFLLAVLSACGWFEEESDREYEDRMLMRHFDKLNHRRPRK